MLVVYVAHRQLQCPDPVLHQRPQVRFVPAIRYQRQLLVVLTLLKGHHQLSNFDFDYAGMVLIPLLSKMLLI